MAFGDKGECSECGRDIGLVEGDAGYVLAVHKDLDGDGQRCPGSRHPPKAAESPEERMTRSHEAWARREREIKERGW